MNKYDKVYVPVLGAESVPVDAISRDGMFYKPITGAIVITIEEARDMFRAGMAHGVRPYDTESWDDYLTSKGIEP